MGHSSSALQCGPYLTGPYYGPYITGNTLGATQYGFFFFLLQEGKEEKRETAILTWFRSVWIRVVAALPTHAAEYYPTTALRPRNHSFSLSHPQGITFLRLKHAAGRGQEP